MSTVARPRTNIFKALAGFFSTGTDIEVEDIQLPAELRDALKSLEIKEQQAELAINSNTSKKGGKGGFAKKINPNTEKAMRAMHNQVKEKKVEDKER